MDPILVVVLMVVVLLFLLAIGMHIAFALAFVGIAGYFVLNGEKSTLGLIATVPYRTMASFLFTTIPLYLFMGEVLASSGLSGELFTATRKWVGRIPGGLAQATIAACCVFAALCGSSGATAAAVGKMAVPEMLKSGYDKKLSTGSVITGGTLGILIPPSVPFIVYGLLTETSVGRLYMAGVVPGIMLAVMYMIFIFIWASLSPRIAPLPPRTSWKEKFVSLKGVIGPGVIILVVLGAIYAGVTTATEAAAIGASGALIVAGIYRRLSWQLVWGALLRSVKTTCMIYAIIMGAFIFGYAFIISGATQKLALFVVGLDVSRWVIMGFIAVFYLVLGTFLEAAAMTILTVPIIVPIVVAMGFDVVWFGVLMVIFSEAALITPPEGTNLFVVKGIAGEGVSIAEIFHGIVPFLGVMILGLILIIIFPQIALWLPSTMNR